MSFYRAALAAAQDGDLTTAYRLASCSIAISEDAPGALKLHELLNDQERLDKATLASLCELLDKRKYRAALKVRLPKTAKAHNIRGLLHALRGNNRAARTEFSLALALDKGNTLALKGIEATYKST